MVLFSPVFYVNHVRLAAAARDTAVPTVYQEDVFVQGGGLISYGVRPVDTWGRAAYYIDRLIKGAKAGELPVEQVSSLSWLSTRRRPRRLVLRFQNLSYCVPMS